MTDKKIRTIELVKPYTDRNKKTLSCGNALTIFPSFNFFVKGRCDMQAVLERRSPYMSGVTVPISYASSMSRMLEKMTEEETAAFYNTVPIIVDFETDYWYYQSSGVAKRRKEFCGIKEMPTECWRLFTVTKATDEKKYWRKIMHEYLNKLRLVFGGREDDSVMIRMTVACMKHAAQNLSAAVPLPVAPIIIGDDASKFYCLKANEIYNRFREHFGLFKAVYYPLHPSVLEQCPNVLREIVKQVYELQPDIVVIGTLRSQDTFCPQGKYDHKRTYFDRLVEEISHYAKTTKSVVMWYDKGDFTSSYGLKLIKEGFDCMITPLRGRYSDGGGATGKGPQYAYILNEYTYLKWDKYLEEASSHYINSRTPEELKKLTPQEQWHYKRLIEIATRSMQFHNIHMKLENEGSLRDYDVQLKRNKIE